eukprot:PITA_28233
MLLKLDLSKAFDKLGWNYIHDMLRAFGFCPPWVRWIMNMITSTHFSILVNGFPSQSFNPSRGIRQGDPLSPFLFVLMAEGLRRHIKQALHSHQIKGISVHNSPLTSHHQFVDDMMLFGYPSAQEAHHLKSLLSDFSEASGMQVNGSKSQIFFLHTPPSVKIAVSNILGFNAASLPTKYLGAPLTDSKLKNPAWRSLLEKFESRLNLWTLRSLNLASRTVLIKSVLQAMPLYLFSILAAPKWVLKSIRNLQRNFLWNSAATNRKWALVKWSNVCMPKEKGGIGLRDPEKSNSIMNAKIWWQWITCPEKPWGQIWTAKYAGNRPQEELIRLIPSENGSAIWNAAKQHYQLIQKHIFWEIRNGRTARFWTDPWNQLPKLQDILHPELIPAGQIQQHEIVHHFWAPEMEHNFRIWRNSNQILPQAAEHQKDQLNFVLQKRWIRQDQEEDILRWGHQPKVSFTTSEAYNLSCSFSSPLDPVWSKIWKLGSWPKIAHFLWLVSHKKILTWDKLRKRSFHGPSLCPNCVQNEETLQHLLADCPLANQLWDRTSFRFQKNCRGEDDIVNALRLWPSQPYNCKILNQLWCILPGIVLWNIWKERNQRIFKSKHSNSEEIWRKIQQNIQETMALHTWTKDDFPTMDNERNILENWQVQLPLDSLNNQTTIAQNRDDCQWQAPPTGTFMLNFDGASKGNPGEAGFGGIIRDSEGNLNLQPIIVEGDSQILINLATRLQKGSNTRKIVPSWRLEARLNALAKQLSNFSAISFSHTKREGNKVADLLANIGTEYVHPLLSGDIGIIFNR